MDCLDCGKEFKQNSNLTRHIKTVHKRMKFKCDHCEKEFGQISIRKTHIKSVQEKIKYPCTLCDYQTSH